MHAQAPRAQETSRVPPLLEHPSITFSCRDCRPTRASERCGFCDPGVPGISNSMTRWPPNASAIFRSMCAVGACWPPLVIAPAFPRAFRTARGAPGDQAPRPLRTGRTRQAEWIMDCLMSIPTFVPRADEAESLRCPCHLEWTVKSAIPDRPGIAILSGLNDDAQ